MVRGAEGEPLADALLDCPDLFTLSTLSPLHLGHEGGQLLPPVVAEGEAALLGRLQPALLDGVKPLNIKTPNPCSVACGAERPPGPHLEGEAEGEAAPGVSVLGQPGQPGLQAAAVQLVQLLIHQPPLRRGHLKRGVGGRIGPAAVGLTPVTKWTGVNVLYGDSLGVGVRLLEGFCQLPLSALGLPGNGRIVVPHPAQLPEKRTHTENTWITSTRCRER
ncbi:hypothetical protein EYF80_062494 [Liparis tanakae]|uniref:Uncharacterized protein n=1 Tax=Liparis tanakae TaxID=230148 RepID=A0A4Z2EGC5_9TELE|nr:hypothetical protein EYF80_062494 [Liparis tanakae]